ncbi:MAG TPA: TIGR03435 family protein [Phycisphaerae bacterium]|nr:TIGR03435 family protein [Phycisphaerae bacterium]
MNLRIGVSLVLSLAFVASGQQAGGPEPQQAQEHLAVGDQAPELILSKLLQAGPTAEAKLADLRGKVVVLEFWGASSRESMQAFAHLNKLAETFKDKPVQFISIAATDESTVKMFVERTPIRGWIGLDDALWTFSDYSASPVPHTVIVDQQGRVAAITKPENVTEAALNDLLAGKPVKLPLKEGKPVKPHWKPGDPKEQPEPEPLVQLAIARCKAGPNQTRFAFGRDGRYFEAYAAPLPTIVALAYEAKPSRIAWMAPMPEDLYKVSIYVPGCSENAVRRMLQDVLAKTFDIRVRWKTGAVPCYVLQRTKGEPWTPPSAWGPKEKIEQIYSGPLLEDGWIRAPKSSLEDVAASIEHLLHRPVLEETGIEGSFDFSIKYKRGDIDGLKAALRTMGLELKEADRRIKVLVVEKGAGDDPS